MKTCAKCGEVKPLDDYYRDKRNRDGREARCKPCRLAQMSAYNARPEVKARKAEHYAQNRDAILASQAEYRARPEVKDRRDEYIREYSARPEVKARKAEYNAANPHIYWENQYRRRAKQYGHPAVIEPFTKDELIARWGDACWHCGGPFEELDHYVVPVALGGHHTLDNCRPSCKPCNAKGWRIRRTNTTTEKSS